MEFIKDSQIIKLEECAWSTLQNYVLIFFNYKIKWVFLKVGKALKNKTIRNLMRKSALLRLVLFEIWIVIKTVHNYLHGWQLKVKDCCLEISVAIECCNEWMRAALKFKKVLCKDQRFVAYILWSKTSSVKAVAQLSLSYFLLTSIILAFFRLISKVNGHSAMKIIG